MSSELWTKEIIAEMQNLTNATVWRILGCHRDIDDMKQEAMMRLFEQRHRIPGGRSRKSYVCTIVKNVIHNFIRRQYRDPLSLTEPVISQVEVGGEAEAECYVYGLYTPVYADPYLVACADKVVAEMTPEHREVLRLKADEYDYNHIAHMLGLSPGTVRSRLHYAKKSAAEKITALMN